MNCNDCGGFLPRGCECSPFGGRISRGVSRSNNDEDIDRGPLTQPAELSQEEWQLHAFRNEGLL